MKCWLCEKEFEPKQRKIPFCFNCLPSGYSGGTVRGKVWKKYAVKIKGGKCARCGYNKCLEALDLHHPKEANKTNRPTELFRYAKTWEEIEKEINECELVCANCHREIHALEE